MDDKPKRVLVESLRFTRERTKIVADVRRFDDAMRAIDFRLCRDPESGIQISRGGLYATCISFPDGTTFAIYYTFDDHQVVLESVRRDSLVFDW
ncbi:MAG: hypothetical protein ACJ76Y_17365 [Thermoanaerobaculia bacterium]